MHFLKTPQRPKHPRGDFASPDGLPIGCLVTSLRWYQPTGLLRRSISASKVSNWLLYRCCLFFFPCIPSLFATSGPPPPILCISTLDNIVRRFDFVMDTGGIISRPMSILYDRHVVSRDTTWRRGSFRGMIFPFFWRSVHKFKLQNIYGKNFREHKEIDFPTLSMYVIKKKILYYMSR